MLYVEVALTLGTWALVAVTVWMACQQSKAFRTDLRARFQLTFTDRFDGQRMRGARKELAHHLLSNMPNDQIDETVMEYFEDMGLFLRRRYLDEELVWSTFGFYGVRWWAACKGYILEERRRQNDSTLFTDFADLGKRFLARDAREGLMEPTPSDLKQFLEDEGHLQ